MPNGVAINPEAAAQCVQDYQRSVVFIRAVYAAISALKRRFADSPIEILYAGCGPFATLLLPLLGKYSPGDLNITLLDIHQRSLDSVERLLDNFGYGIHAINTVRGDACVYQHSGKLHLVIAETMQKALEQEPQFAVTANLAPQMLLEGIFLPQRIDVGLSLADLEKEALFFESENTKNPTRQQNRPRRYPIAALCSLSPDNARAQSQAARHNPHTNKLELESTIVEVPSVENLTRLNAALFTRIVIYERYCLEAYQAEITLPLRCYELEPLCGGERYRASYQLGNYPKFHFERLGAG